MGVMLAVSLSIIGFGRKSLPTTNAVHDPGLLLLNAGENCIGHILLEGFRALFQV